MNNQSYDSDDWTKWIQFLQSVNKTGVYNGRDLSRMKHAFSTPGMTFIGVHETLSVGKEFDALLGLTRRGNILWRKREYKKMGNMFDYVNKHIMKEFNEIINRGDSLTPEQKQMFETIKKTGSWTTDEAFNAIYLGKGPDKKEGVQGLITFLRKNNLGLKRNNRVPNTQVIDYSHMFPKVDSSNSVSSTGGTKKPRNRSPSSIATQTTILGAVLYGLKEGGIESEFISNNENGNIYIKTEEGVFIFTDNGSKGFYTSKKDPLNIIRVGID